MSWGNRKCEICHIEPCNPFLKKPLCTQCFKDMKAFSKRVERELRRREE